MHRWIIAAAFALISCGSTTQKAEMPPAESETETTESIPENSTETAAAVDPEKAEAWRDFRRVVNDQTGEVVWEGPDQSKIEVQKEEVSDEAAHKAFLKAFYARLAEQEYELKQERLEQHESRPAYFRTYLFSYEGVDFEAFIWNYMDRGNAVTISGKFPLGSEGLKTFREFLKSKKHQTEP